MHKDSTAKCTSQNVLRLSIFKSQNVKHFNVSPLTICKLKQNKLSFWLALHTWGWWFTMKQIDLFNLIKLELTISVFSSMSLDYLEIVRSMLNSLFAFIEEMQKTF